MKVMSLTPKPKDREFFRRDRHGFIPNISGCYLLVTFGGDILYIGLSTQLRTRFGNHLDDPLKRKLTKYGRAFFFYWMETLELEKIERTWLNQCELVDGKLPVLNKVNSPVSI